jgi:Icc-related predicted phosphoesterase
VIIDDIRFLGTTLWFRETQDATMFNNMLSDFKLIEDFQQKVYEENKKSITFLQDNVDKNDIVITHHLPSYQSVQPVYIGEPTNCYYVCNMEELILSKEPSLWIHGHTHHSCDYSFQGTRIVCNPAGYPDSFYKLPTNPVFNIEKAVELNF